MASQRRRTSPWDPVWTLRRLSFCMARAQALKKAGCEDAKRETVARVRGSLQRIWSDASNPSPCCRLLKKTLSNCLGVLTSLNATTVGSRFTFGQDALSCAAYVLFNVGSGIAPYTRFINWSQCEKPIVCPPTQNARLVSHKFKTCYP